MVRKRLLDASAKDHLSDFEKNFKSKARFLVDESVGIAAVELIRDRGWNVLYVDDVGFLAQSKEEILTFAWREQRILLTHNLEFLDDCRFPFRHNPGLVILPGASGNTLGLENAINSVLALIGPYFKAYRSYKIRITEDGIWRIRRFDTKEGIHREICVKFGKMK